MATVRDFEQMLKCGLTLKEEAQKIIDFAKLSGAGSGGEGEEDLEEVDNPEEDAAEGEDTKPGEPPKTGVNGKNMAIILALKERMKKKK